MEERKITEKQRITERRRITEKLLLLAILLIGCVKLIGCAKPFGIGTELSEEHEKLHGNQSDIAGNAEQNEEDAKGRNPNASNEEGGNAVSQKESNRGPGDYKDGLPIIYLNTEREVEDAYHSAEMRMDGKSLYADELLYDGTIQIKLRGNSTRYRPKRSYKIKLESKADLFGMGANKHWVLLANDIDHTLIRNKLVYDFAAAIGMEYAPESVLVAVVKDGVYEGVYQLCEHVRVGKERVAIFDWDDLAEDMAKAIVQEEAANGLLTEKQEDGSKKLENALKKDYAWLCPPYRFTYQNQIFSLTDYLEIPPATGGFLLEMDFYTFGDPSRSALITNFEQPFYFNTPERVSEESDLYAYAKNYLQAFEYAVHSADFAYHSEEPHYQGTGLYYDWGIHRWISKVWECGYADPTYEGCHYSELFDMDSLVQNFLVCELTMNWDSMKNSVFLYKDIEGPAKMGPVWDFDWAFGNINMYDIDTWYPTGWQTTNNYFTNEQYYQSVQWNRYLIRDPYFVMKVYEKYYEIRGTAVEDMVRSISVYEEQLAKEGKENDIRWRATYQDGAWYFGRNGQDFKKSFERLKEFVTIRLAWLDRQFADLDTLILSLGAYEKADQLSAEAAQKPDGSYEITVQSQVPGCKAVLVQINGTDRVLAELTQNKAVLSDLGINKSGKTMITVFALDANGAFLRRGSETEAPPISSYCYLE